MDNKIKVGIVAAGAGLAYVYFNQQSKQVKGAVNITVLSFDITNPAAITAKLNLFNPTRVTVNVDSLAATVLFNGDPIGSIQYINRNPIQALANTVWVVPVALSDIGIMVAARDLVERSTASGVISIQGNIYIGGIANPFIQTSKIW
jgi:hypothetical protein